MERIHVTVRARPLSVEDAKSSPWKISANSIFSPNQSSKFEFDRIFGEGCKTTEVYDARTKEIVAAAIRGFNGTVFAYGQTNSGKTHTMRGSPNEPGIIPLSVHSLFDNIQQGVNREFLLRMSYMEIYNEEINDLLVPEHRKLQIHESLERGIYVAGLREEIVVSPEQVLDLMEFGESHRHIGETNMNLYSSRSHTIFRMIIESRDKIEDENFGNSCDAVRVSVLNLVDLAGSERASKTGAEGVRLKEGSHINKSLMTLGTVIKKLSEGAESQGGHVPYRDSKLTRILQPSLGGNANTAIICNITLAQIHADETKSSLQFASRALRVTNCAQVNEILTDAALLKRQKNEIEELRSKLQGSHSEHLEEEILSLRNTLLQTELERERIALELEEEKKAQAEWEKRVQEQAKKIENLSSMVLYSSRDENQDRSKKGKRRDTWCPGKLSRDPVAEVYSTNQSTSSTVKPTIARPVMGSLCPFQELMDESGDSESGSCNRSETYENFTASTYHFPDPRALMHVTNRRKVALKKKSLPDEGSEVLDIQAAYEDLFLKFESQKTVSDIEADCLVRKLDEIDCLWDVRSNSTDDVKSCTINGDKSISLRESEAILVIKRLQEQIKILEIEKSSSQQNLDCVVEIATEHNICAQEKFEELSEELRNARSEARRANERLNSAEFDGSSDLVSKLSLEVQEVISEVQNSKNIVGIDSLLIDEVARSFSGLYEMFLGFKTSIRESCVQQKSIIHDHGMLNDHLMHKVSELENDKLLLIDQSVGLQKQIEVLRLDAENYEYSLTALSELRNSEYEEYLFQIQTLEKEISNLSSSSLIKEKESLRKDLEKTKVKFKETESKLKNVMQEKTKLEGEKAMAEKEIKRLHGQNSLLERDSMIERRSSKLFDPKRSKSIAIPFDHIMQEDYKKLEILAFELETEVASLKEELAVVSFEKEEVILTNEGLVSELESVTHKLNMSNSELNVLLEEVSALRQRMEESKLSQEKLESSIKLLEDSKEELSMQLTDSLLQMEEERAIWSSKEKACLEALEDKAKLHHMEITSLSKELLEVKNDLEYCREECKLLRKKVTYSEEIAKNERENRIKCLNEWSNTEKAKLRMRLRGTQAQLNAYKIRYMEAMEESNLMHRKFEEAAGKLKDRLASKGIEVLNLKRQLSTLSNK